VLTQIIVEQEGKEGQNLLPVTFLRQLIRFYGDSMQTLVPRYLEVSIDSLTRDQQKYRDQMSQAFGVSPFGALDETVRRNMEVFQRAFTMFTPFARRDEEAANGEAAAAAAGATAAPTSTADLDELKRQLDDMRKKVEKLSEGEK
jgi:polyhydroxyalkanoate synthesis regulator protein